VRDETARLLAAARSFGQTLDSSRLLVRICEHAVRVVDAQRADVYLCGDELRREATYGRPARAIGAGAGELAAAVTERGAPMTLGPAAAVPLRWDEELRGVLVVELDQRRAAAAAEVRLLGELADLASAALRNASAYAGLALAARMDGLTGCLNHAAMHDTLRRELERCRRGGGRLSLAIVDLDDFKQVNEEHGHQAGDDVLKRVGRALRDSVRTYDVVARYGGDEFAVIAIDADERMAVDVAERALEALRHSAVAATAGVAEWSPDESPTMLIARADAALLFAKHEGERASAMAASDVPNEFARASGRR
jgi:diguanylate cyclase (GGDEF)-like protein